MMTRVLEEATAILEATAAQVVAVPVTTGKSRLPHKHKDEKEIE